MPSTQTILDELAQLPWVEAAFLLDTDENLLGHAGEIDAFDPKGTAREPNTTSEGPGDTCLYVASITKKVVLGVLYSGDIEVEDVRKQVGARKQSLSANLA